MGHGGAVKGEVCQRKEQDEEIRKQSQGQRPVAGALRASGIPLQATRKLSPSLQQRLSSCFSPIHLLYAGRYKSFYVDSPSNVRMLKCCIMMKTLCIAHFGRSPRRVPRSQLRRSFPVITAYLTCDMLLSGSHGLLCSGDQAR